MDLIFKIWVGLLFAATGVLAEPLFGVHVGAGMAGYNGEESVEGGLYYSVGGAMSVPLSEGVDFYPQLLYGHRKAFQSLSIYLGYGVPIEYEVIETVHVLELPLLFRFELSSEFYLLAGPQLGYLLYSELQTDVGVDGNVKSQTQNVTDQLNMFEYGIALGGGYQINDVVSIDFKYNYGLNALEKNANTDATPYQWALGGTLLL